MRLNVEQMETSQMFLKRKHPSILTSVLENFKRDHNNISNCKVCNQKSKIFLIKFTQSYATIAFTLAVCRQLPNVCIFISIESY